MPFHFIKTDPKAVRNETVNNTTMAHTKIDLMKATVKRGPSHGLSGQPAERAI